MELVLEGLPGQRRPLAAPVLTRRGSARHCASGRGSERSRSARIARLTFDIQRYAIDKAKPMWSSLGRQYAGCCGKDDGMLEGNEPNTGAGEPRSDRVSDRVRDRRSARAEAHNTVLPLGYRDARTKPMTSANQTATAATDPRLVRTGALRASA